ncbi:MAG TPA: hypothetical protein VLX09_06910 [Stellaceae bacterium]|nr:hypothetical protein [Stellaceae bacterium]
MKALISAAMLVMMLASADARADRTVPFGQVSYWNVFAYFDDNNRFGFCGMRTGSVNGPEMLTLSMNESGVVMFLDSNQWSLPIGDTYDVAVKIGGDAWTGKAKVYSQNGVNMWWDWSQDFADAFMGGSRMIIQFRNGRYWTVDLRGSRQALTVLARCLVANNVSKNPFK